MGYTNLLAKIEAEYNHVTSELNRTNDFTNDHLDKLRAKKAKLKELALDYIKLENKFKEIVELKPAH